MLSELIGAVRGEEMGRLDEKIRLEALEEVSDGISPAESLRFRLNSPWSSDSMERKLRFCQPRLILRLASARRSCNARVTCQMKESLGITTIRLEQRRQSLTFET